MVTLNKDPLFFLLLIISFIGILGHVDMPNLLKLLRTEALFPQSYHTSDLKDSVTGFLKRSCGIPWQILILIQEELEQGAG